ncbi:MAG: tetratricopeptide repeat protein, partial [Desulfobacterales bacterium]|nr:tetratricopeptide repeat protein [Desulfobacterales bacterium]
AAGVVIGLQAYASFVYVPHWENNFTLQAYTVDRHPASGRFQGFWARAVLEYAMTQEGHAKQRLLADAERTANAALNQWPQNQGPYAILGVVEYERGNRERADEYLEYARQHAMGPGFTEFIMAYLGMMEDVEEIRTEIEVFEQRRDTGELDREDRRRLARLYGTVKEWEDAEEAFEVAIDEPESDVDFLYAYLDVLIMRDKHADALEVYRRLIELEPNQWSHYVDAGIVGVMAGARIEDEAERGRVMSEALGWLHRAMELSPGSPEPWSAMADYFVLNGDWERARMASDEALLRSSPSDIRHRQFQMQRELIEKNL